MNPISIVLLGFAMSTDAFAAALGKGAAMSKPRWPQALRIGLLFGVIEALTPIAGWLLGSAASSYIQQWDHWVAFGLLGGLGAHMIHKAMQPDDENAVELPPSKSGLITLALTALATSIDALAVGVGLAFVNVNILVVAAVIGICTCTMVTLGVMTGRAIGAVIGKRAELIGGVVLIAVGGTILYEHLSSAAA